MEIILYKESLFCNTIAYAVSAIIFVGYDCDYLLGTIG